MVINKIIPATGTATAIADPSARLRHGEPASTCSTVVLSRGNKIDVPANANRLASNPAIDIDIASGSAQVAAQWRVDTNGAAHERGIACDLVIDADLPAGGNEVAVDAPAQTHYAARHTNIAVALRAGRFTRLHQNG
jgi:hypothetical protein